LPQLGSRAQQADLPSAFEVSFPALLLIRAAGPILLSFPEKFPIPLGHFLKKTPALDSMIRILSALVASAFVLVSASCCCTGEPKAPRLRKLPEFQEIETTTTTATEVEYSK